MADFLPAFPTGDAARTMTLFFSLPGSINVICSNGWHHPPNQAPWLTHSSFCPAFFQLWQVADVLSCYASTLLFLIAPSSSIHQAFANALHLRFLPCIFYAMCRHLPSLSSLCSTPRPSFILWQTTDTLLINPVCNCSTTTSISPCTVYAVWAQGLDVRGFGSALVALTYWQKVREKTWESSPGQVPGGGRGCPFYLRWTYLPCQSLCHKIPISFQPQLWCIFLICSPSFPWEDILYLGTFSMTFLHRYSPHWCGWAHLLAATWGREVIFLFGYKLLSGDWVLYKHGIIK